MHTTISFDNYSPSEPHDTDAEIRIPLELRLPRHAAKRLHDSMLKGDTDAVLAAERAICEAIDCDGAQVWLDPDDNDLRNALLNEAAIEEQSQRIYGPQAG